VTGALAGGVLGALIDAGEALPNAERYAADHGSGRSVVSVLTDTQDVASVTKIMDAAMPEEAKAP